MNATRWILAMSVCVLGWALFLACADQPGQPAGGDAPASQPVTQPVEAEPLNTQEALTRARKLYDQGNWKEAYDLYRPIVLGDRLADKTLAETFGLAITSLRNLNRHDEIDGFRNAAVAAHGEDWRLLLHAAGTIVNGQHHGYIVAGKFHRGQHRGGGKYVSSFVRDRAQALAWMVRAMDHLPLDEDKLKRDISDFYSTFAGLLMHGRSGNMAWRLQYLTDLTELPDYDTTGYGRHGGSRGAPVGPDGKPIFYTVPESWAAAENDGQRWRWALAKMVEYNPNWRDHAKAALANFLHQQFGVQTIAQYRVQLDQLAEQGDQAETGTWALHTLKENETIARLASGVKRITLPEEFNFIRLYRETNNSYQLASIFENRRQYPKAAEIWEKIIRQSGREDVIAHLDEQDWMWRPKPRRSFPAWDRLAQIRGNMGQFEPVFTQPAGRGAEVAYTFRNASSVTFTAHEIDIDKLIDDVKAYYRSKPDRIDRSRASVEHVGYRLVAENQTKYLKAKAAEWTLLLEPRPDHWDRRINVTTPLQTGGAYLLTAKLPKGNTSSVVLWLADMALVNKPLDNRQWYFVADAVTGEPINNATVEIFGYHRDRVHRKILPDTWRWTYREFDEPTDSDGQVIVGQGKAPNHFNWLTVARTDAGGLAYLGFRGIWYQQRHDRQYHAQRLFGMTDRPVYRPGQSVKFHFWANVSQYDRTGPSPLADKPVVVRVSNPRGETVYEKSFVLDQYGGAGADLALPDEAALGMYQIAVWHGTTWGTGGSYLGNFSCRVEEYKKPEYEVSIDAPAEPVALGETITATIRAEYYFGGPVTEATVHYKVTRHEHNATWYPPGPWDWLFGPGYWWFAYDYKWYPGWHRWGCGRPVYRWMPWWRPTPPPELVAEDTVNIDADGTVKVRIDTALAKALFGDRDHRYEITAELRDASRRTIVGKRQVLVARRPFKVYAWTGRGFYRAGDTVGAEFAARRLDGKGVTGQGKLRLLKIDYKDGKPVETEVESWTLPTDQAGRASKQLVAAEAGQYRLSYTLTDDAGHDIQGGYLFTVWGRNEAADSYRFNAVELMPDKKHYAPGETVDMRINTDQRDATVILFTRPTNGVYLPPKTIRLQGRSVTEAIAVTQKDMPNFFVEALTVSGGKAHTTVRQIVVPPARRILDMSVETDKPTYKPGEKATLRVKLTDEQGKPFVGAVVLTMYDKAVEYISGGSNVPDIRKFFWDWKRSHRPNTTTSLARGSGNLITPEGIAMQSIGVFGASVADEGFGQTELDRGSSILRRQMPKPVEHSAPMAEMKSRVVREDAVSEAGSAESAKGGAPTGDGSDSMAATTVRTKFADTALWAGHVVTDDDGTATIELAMPENLTTWTTRAWAMGDGTRVGQATAEAITTKDLLVRIAAPRFLVQGDEVTLSAIVMNRLKTDKTARAELQLGGELLELIGSDEPGMFDSLSGEVKVPAGGEARVNWRVRAKAEGEAKITVKALTDEESDAMQIPLPVLVHGMLKTESFSGVIRPDPQESSFTLTVPEQRRPAESRLEIRYSPTLAMSMIDALPYLVEYPYGCTEQTLNRFVPTVIAQKTLLDMNVDLAAIGQKITNLNAQEIGDDVKRAADWKRLLATKRWNGEDWVDRNPVYSKAELEQMVKVGVARLTSMQCSDGGWGWFSGSNERSYPHTTAVVVHGLLQAKVNDVKIDSGVISRGVKWLERYQAEQVEKLTRWQQGERGPGTKQYADNLDALVAFVISEAGGKTEAMRTYLYRDRLKLSLYGMCLAGLTFDNADAAEQRDMIIRNVGQYLVTDEENQSAYLHLPKGRYGWYRWYWYGSEIETMAFYLKLLCRTEPKGKAAAGLVKYLLNNRRHATYWNSTRDTAYVIEAFADYIRATGEAEPDMTIEILIDGQVARRVKITKENLFAFDNAVVLTGKDVTTGEHTVTVRRQGAGPVYFNAYLTNFTLEDPIAKAGLEIKVRRTYYKLVPVDKAVHVEGSHGQAVTQRVEKYRRVEIPDPFSDESATPPVASGDLIEVELILESKNDYEYIVIEDPKAAGCEPTEVRSGYTGNEMGAYVEFRDERVVLFVRRLARGTHSVSYRLFAETPGRFSALPSKARAMYAPELRGNSNEQKLTITEAKSLSN